LDAIFQPELDEIEDGLKALLSSQVRCPLPELERFWDGLGYSLYSPGKRFRPLLAALTAESLGQPTQDILPLAVAVELIHTYSLIHDDLPCMDNDDFRRGRPSQHKAYGEAQALLVGDALLTMAFEVLSLSESPHAARAVTLLAQAAGANGMVGGQILDIEVGAKADPELLGEIHRRKTGALIRVSVEAAAILCNAAPEALKGLRTYGEELGLAFQLADDIQDHDPDQPEATSFASLLGVNETKRQLEQASQRALEAIAPMGGSAKGLRRLVQLNLERI